MKKPNNVRLFAHIKPYDIVIRLSDWRSNGCPAFNGNNLYMFPISMIGNAAYVHFSFYGNRNDIITIATTVVIDDTCYCCKYAKIKNDKKISDSSVALPANTVIANLANEINGFIVQHLAARTKSHKSQK